MRTLEQLKSMFPDAKWGEDGFTGQYSTQGRTYNYIFSYGGGWEHASVSVYPRGGMPRVPNWDEMCMFKDLFWLPEETVVQYHPAKADYVNMHPYVLHLWRKINGSIPTPPKIFVGI